MSNFLKEFSKREDLQKAIDNEISTGVHEFGSPFFDKDLLFLNVLIYKGWKSSQDEFKLNVIAEEEVFKSCTEILLAVRLAYWEKLASLVESQQEEQRSLKKKVQQNIELYLELEKLFYPFGKTEEDK